jgi:hypothetical protein
MNFNDFTPVTRKIELSTVTPFTEELLKNNFHHLLGAGDALDDFA